MLAVVLPFPLPCEIIDSSFHCGALRLLSFPLPGGLPASCKAGTHFGFGSLQPLALIGLAVARRYFFAFFLAAFFLVAFFVATFLPAFFATFFAAAFFAAFFFAFAI